MTLACDDSSTALKFYYPMIINHGIWFCKELMDYLGTFLFYRRGKLRPRERK